MASYFTAANGIYFGRTGKYERQEDGLYRFKVHPPDTPQPRDIFATAPIPQSVPTKAEVVDELIKLSTAAGEEARHFRADELLLLYINDKEITEAHKAMKKYYV